MRKLILVVMLGSISVSSVAQDNFILIDPNKIQMNGYVHKELPKKLLKRIKATTDVFEIVDGVTFDKAVDLYKRDVNPEENLVIWEEMARVYQSFCKSRCSSPDEKMDVYRTLLLRSMFSKAETMARLDNKILSRKQAEFIVDQYRLEAKPIDVVSK